jgi:hypothetical protein
MADLQEVTERHAAMLGRLADAAERLAMKHAERALACDDPVVEARATSAFHKAARCARQCAALEAKLIRDAADAGREAKSRAEWADDTAAYDRRRQVGATVERLIRNDPGTSGDAEHLCNELDDLLDIEELNETFLTEDLTVQITRLCKELGITGFEILAVLPPLSSRPDPGEGRGQEPGPIDSGPS